MNKTYTRPKTNHLTIDADLMIATSPTIPYGGSNLEDGPTSIDTREERDWPTDCNVWKEW